MMQTAIPCVRQACGALIVAAVVAIHINVAAAQCVGDCSGDGEVTVNEIVLGVNIALGTADLSACPAFDADASGDVTVNEIVAAVNNALLGCPTVAPTNTALPTLVPTNTAIVAATNMPTEHASVTAAPTDTPSTAPSPTPASPTPAGATPTNTVGGPTATATATATAGAAMCGDGVLQAGETCDDGNTITNPPADTCPSDCTIINCSSAGTTHTISVSFTPPAGKSVSSISVLLEYPDGTIKVQGTGSDTSVQAAVTNTPGGALVASFDYDYAISVQLAGTHAITPGKLFDLTAKDCKGAGAPTVDQFKCRVTDATAPDSSSVVGVTCVAALR